ncbi:MAG: acetone carboxylase subunit gamma [Alphaproteobacteria bacterium]|nr:MAG: acetone carboxylase subunit gamma [Alphaproteobacteria bacterium]
MTESLRIDLDQERWECSKCDTSLGNAREPYKKGLNVYDRDPREVHAALLDQDKYEYSFAPDPTWIRILEYYCPHCGTQMEVEYLPPGHPPTIDIEFDLDALKKQWADRKELPNPVIAPIGEIS